MSCLSPIPQHNPEGTTAGVEVEEYKDGFSLSIGGSGIPIDGSAVGATLESGSDEITPMLYTWDIESIDTPVAFGISFDGSHLVVGDGLQNLYYLSEGAIVQDGAFLQVAPVIVAGSKVQLLIDPLNDAAAFFLNEVPV